ncbi:MAG TPA: hypothetical protein VHX63_07570 [Acidobacteriaceae bacterium]|jgi:hypothetical protein|nr:hypothetical protein [Acidobacteriaceae bacterium]
MEGYRNMDDPPRKVRSGGTFARCFDDLRIALIAPRRQYQKLDLRYANSRITLEVYTQAVGSNKRAAQSNVVRMMIPGVGQNRVRWTRKKPALELNGPLSDPDLIVTYRSPFDSKSFRIYGGDDGARTRDLCRDRSAFGWYLIEFMSTLAEISTAFSGG